MSRQLQLYVSDRKQTKMANCFLIDSKKAFDGKKNMMLWKYNVKSHAFKNVQYRCFINASVVYDCELSSKKDIVKLQK